jgi:hypothetical protein
MIWLVFSSKGRFKFCFWILNWNYFERKKANFAVKGGQFGKKFNEFASKIKKNIAEG